MLGFQFTCTVWVSFSMLSHTMRLVFLIAILFPIPTCFLIEHKANQLSISHTSSNELRLLVRVSVRMLVIYDWISLLYALDLLTRMYQMHKIAPQNLQNDMLQASREDFQIILTVHSSAYFCFHYDRRIEAWWNSSGRHHNYVYSSTLGRYCAGQSQVTVSQSSIDQPG